MAGQRNTFNNLKRLWELIPDVLPEAKQFWLSHCWPNYDLLMDAIIASATVKDARTFYHEREHKAVSFDILLRRTEIDQSFYRFFWDWLTSERGQDRAKLVLQDERAFSAMRADLLLRTALAQQLGRVASTTAISLFMDGRVAEEVVGFSARTKSVMDVNANLHGRVSRLSRLLGKAGHDARRLVWEIDGVDDQVHRKSERLDTIRRIIELGFPARTCGLLQKSGILTILQLAACTPAALSTIRGFNRSDYSEVVQRLGENGYRLADAENVPQKFR
ncbi:MAG: DNA-directed RNA polymerase subunit alpha C-terminal domain-containing protein [Patescibacteria group bacterium]|jgi:hypothetical protein